MFKSSIRCNMQLHHPLDGSTSLDVVTDDVRTFQWVNFFCLRLYWVDDLNNFLKREICSENKSWIWSFNTVFNEKKNSLNLIEVAVSFIKNSKRRFKSKWLNICSTYIASKTQCLCMEFFICIMFCSINLSCKFLVWHNTFSTNLVVGPTA